MRCAPLSRSSARLLAGLVCVATLAAGSAAAQRAAPLTAPVPPAPPGAQAEPAPSPSPTPSPSAPPAPGVAPETGAAPGTGAPAAAAGPDMLDPDACLALIAENPAGAAEAARRWFRFGGGVSAAVCESLALEAMGALGAAALRLDLAASTAGSAASALHESAAGFWLRDGQPTAALNSAEAGLTIEPAAALLLRRKAEALVALDRREEAAAPLDAAIEADPEDAAARLLRARLKRESGDPAAAFADADAAVRLGPDDARAWFESGAAQAAMDRRPEAREALLTAIDLDRDGPVGAEARAVLQRMELGGD